MNVTFADPALAELYETGKTNGSRYKKLMRNAALVRGYQRAVTVMYDMETTDDLRRFSFLHYERLKYKMPSMSSVRIVNGRIERLLFTETEDGISVELIEINDTHYGNKK